MACEMEADNGTGRGVGNGEGMSANVGVDIDHTSQNLTSVIDLDPTSANFPNSTENVALGAELYSLILYVQTIIDSLDSSENFENSSISSENMTERRDSYEFASLPLSLLFPDYIENTHSTPIVPNSDQITKLQVTPVTNEGIQRAPECKICFQNLVNVFLIPCNHACICSICSKLLENVAIENAQHTLEYTINMDSLRPICPVCREPVKEQRPCYFS